MLVLISDYVYEYLHISITIRAIYICLSLSLYIYIYISIFVSLSPWLQSTQPNLYQSTFSQHLIKVFLKHFRNTRQGITKVLRQGITTRYYKGITTRYYKGITTRYYDIFVQPSYRGEVLRSITCQGKCPVFFQWPPARDPRPPRPPSSGNIGAYKIFFCS